MLANRPSQFAAAFLRPQHGQILIDSHNIRTFTLKSLRDQMTVVMQEARLFNQTVRENIRFGKIDATEEEIVQAAKLAQAHDFIMQMPDGYDSIVLKVVTISPVARSSASISLVPSFAIHHS